MYDDPNNSIKDICKTLHISKKTLYRYVEPGKRGVVAGNKSEG
ncbi:MAG: helix-turn-helix domain-containing protein [Thermoproteota archaeon]|nr:helix-turn-helix domain-containing protein [Thermoproteota archaeon]